MHPPKVKQLLNNGAPRICVAPEEKGKRDRAGPALLVPVGFGRLAPVYLAALTIARSTSSVLAVLSGRGACGSNHARSAFALEAVFLLNDLDQREEVVVADVALVESRRAAHCMTKDRVRHLGVQSVPLAQRGSDVSKVFERPLFGIGHSLVPDPHETPINDGAFKRLLAIVAENGARSVRLIIAPALEGFDGACT